MFLTILLVGCYAFLVASAPSSSLGKLEAEKQQQQLKSSNDVTQFQGRPILLVGPQPQFEYQPSFRLQQPLYQQLIPFGQIQGPNEQSMVLFYPNAPLSPLAEKPNLQLQLVRQAPGQQYFDDFWNFINQVQVPGNPIKPPGSGGSGDDDSSSSSSSSSSSGSSSGLLSPLQSASAPIKPASSGNFELESEAEEIPKQPALPQFPQTPASTYPLPGFPNGFIYYTITGQPQYFTSFSNLKNPQLPFFRYPETPTALKEIEKTQNYENKPGEAAKRFSQFLIDQKIYQPQPILIRAHSIGNPNEKPEFSGRVIEGQSVKDEKISKDQIVIPVHPVVSGSVKEGVGRSISIISSATGDKEGVKVEPHWTSVSEGFQ